MELGKTFFGVNALGHCSAVYRNRDRRRDNRPLRRVQEEKTASILKWGRTWPCMHRGADRRAVTAQRGMDLHSDMTWREKKGKYGGMTGTGSQHRTEEPMVTLKHLLPNEDMSA